MANPTTNYGFVLPTPTDLVTDLPADFEVALQGVDTQMKTNADAAIAKTIVDAKGDLIAGTGSDTVSRLAIGTNDQVLTADSTTATGMKWATSASGGMTLISTTTLTGSSVTLSSIPSTYKDLQLVIRNFRSGTDGDYIYLRFNGDSNNNRYRDVGYSVANGVFTFDDDKFELAQNIDTDTSQGLTIMQIPDYANAVTWKMVNCLSGINNSTTPTSVSIDKRLGFYNQTSAINSITIFAVGTLAAGTALLYGVQ
jgi:hypothetical protein